MQNKYTFTMIKPSAFAKGDSGKIIDRINSEGFKIRAMKTTLLTKAEAASFYSVHKKKYFFEELVEFMCSGLIIVAILEKENAVENYRKLIGNTDPQKAAEGTIRKEFASSKRHNAVHGADSNENAQIEAGFFFPKREWM